MLFFFFFWTAEDYSGHFSRLDVCGWSISYFSSIQKALLVYCLLQYAKNMCECEYECVCVCVCRCSSMLLQISVCPRVFSKKKSLPSAGSEVCTRQDCLFHNHREEVAACAKTERSPARAIVLMLLTKTALSMLVGNLVGPPHPGLCPDWKIQSDLARIFIFSRWLLTGQDCSDPHPHCEEHHILFFKLKLMLLCLVSRG